VPDSPPNRHTVIGIALNALLLVLIAYGYRQSEEWRWAWIAVAIPIAIVTASYVRHWRRK
jgi:hypothetical protein